jgi:hypothetical protein
MASVWTASTRTRVLAIPALLVIVVNSIWMSAPPILAKTEAFVTPLPSICTLVLATPDTPDRTVKQTSTNAFPALATMGPLAMTVSISLSAPVFLVTRVFSARSISTNACRILV